MKNGLLGKILTILVILVLLGLAISLVTGVFRLLSGALNTILGLALVVGLVLIVLWMFRYAKR
jgi:hypothetical protein